MCGGLFWFGKIAGKTPPGKDLHIPYGY